METLILAQLIHEERIREAHEAAFAASARQGASPTQHLRMSIAQALHWLAVRVQPDTSTAAAGLDNENVLRYAR